MNLDEVDKILETEKQHTNDREHHSNEAVCSDADCNHTRDNEYLGTDFDSVSFILVTCLLSLERVAGLQCANKLLFGVDVMILIMC